MAKYAPGYVYLAEKDGLYRIGISAKPRQRVGGLDATLIHAIGVDNMGAVEGHFHRKHRSTRVIGEWFRLTPEEVQDFISCREATCIRKRCKWHIEFTRDPQSSERNIALVLLADEERIAAIDALRQQAARLDDYIASRAFTIIAAALTEARNREEE
jgi:hypothetical protein